MKLPGGNQAQPIKVVPLRLIGSSEPMDVGIRVLSVRERRDVYRQAKAEAKAAGCEKWDLDDPICSLEIWVHTVAAAVVDVDSDPESPEPLATAEELRDDWQIGQENLQYLYEVYEAHEAQNSFRAEEFDREKVFDIAIRLAGGDETPLDGMRLYTLRAFARTTASLLVALTIDASLSSSEGAASPKPSSDSKAGSTKTVAKKAGTTPTSDSGSRPSEKNDEAEADNSKPSQ